MGALTVRRACCGAAVVLAAALLIAAAGVADGMDGTTVPNSAATLCRDLKAVTVPPGDAPTPAEAAALADCSSEALYYGIGRPADAKAARLCAFVERKAADPQVTDFGFTGDRMLMTIYANGLGAARDLDVAMALACRAGGAPAEIEGRVRHLARLRAEHWAGTDFSLCDDVTSGLMMGVCADHAQLIVRATRARAFAIVSAGWSADERAAFAPLARAESAFVDARGENEVDQTGSGRGAFVVEAEDRQERAFAALLADTEAGRIAVATKSDAQTAEAALNAAYGALLRRAPALAKDTTLTAAGLRAAQRVWLRYRDAWLAFAKLRYPSLSADVLQTRLTRDRTAQIADVPAAE